jgi:hypothetical protein
MVITAEDLAHDRIHLSISGHRKQAALEWRILGRLLLADLVC